MGWQFMLSHRGRIQISISVVLGFSFFHGSFMRSTHYLVHLFMFFLKFRDFPGKIQPYIQLCLPIQCGLSLLATGEVFSAKSLLFLANFF